MKKYNKQKEWGKGKNKDRLIPTDVQNTTKKHTHTVAVTPQAHSSSRAETEDSEIAGKQKTTGEFQF